MYSILKGKIKIRFLSILILPSTGQMEALCVKSETMTH